MSEAPAITEGRKASSLTERLERARHAMRQMESAARQADAKSIGWGSGQAASTYRETAEALTAAIDTLERQPADPLLRLADALGCFWNAALYATHEAQDSTANAVMSGMVQGVAAVAERLKVLPAREALLSSLLLEALKGVRSWADKRCPCGPPDYPADEPKICPLCGADRDGAGLDGVCKAAEAIFPRDLLRTVDAAIRQAEAAASIQRTA